MNELEALVHLHEDFLGQLEQIWCRRNLGAAMARPALISPEEYVDLLHAIVVPGYTGYPGGLVSITSYMSANPMFGGGSGGNAKAGKLRNIIRRIAKGRPDAWLVEQPGFNRVFSGQGSLADFALVMGIVNFNRDEIKKDKDFAPYFANKDFLQEMADDGVFGIDCIGFTGNYMVEAKLHASYKGLLPIDYSSTFRPVKSLGAIQKYGVVMLTNGLHIQFINDVRHRNGYVLLDLCQSSTGGPQLNTDVRLSQPSGGGNYLPVDDFRRALQKNTYAADHKADNDERKTRGEKPRDYETYLRARLTVSGRQFGLHGGAIFQLARNGDPANPVGGSVYVGVVDGGISLRTP
ncbi:hypothetical protein ACQKLX_09375 [Bosea sp. NPDC003192]|uniref:hypothetical protein n=1 Tax=Bosea sp. NPDC003192 TaxID=3390551 RepID=UPI003D04042A